MSSSGRPRRLRAGAARLSTALADLVLPVACAGCGRVGARWCPACRSRFRHPGIRAVAGLPPVVVLAPYAGPARVTVLAYKERGRRDLAGPLAACVASGLVTTGFPPALGRGAHLAVVPAPSRRSAARARGGDHMVRLARALVRRVGRTSGSGYVTLAPALELRAGARDSVGLDPAARAGNLARHLRVRRHALPPAGTPVLLLDDVLTTGATARAATAALRRAGCPVVAVVVLTAAPRHRSRGPTVTVGCHSSGREHPPATVRPGVSLGRENRPNSPSRTGR